MYDDVNAIDPGWATTPCRLGDPEDWFPFGVEGGENYQAEADRAKARCLTCPMLGDCREIALTTWPSHGVWGATTPAERRALRSRSARV